jgi:hypothetical protein
MGSEEASRAGCTCLAVLDGIIVASYRRLALAELWSPASVPAEEAGQVGTGRSPDRSLLCPWKKSKPAFPWFWVCQCPACLVLIKGTLCVAAGGRQWRASVSWHPDTLGRA